MISNLHDFLYEYFSIHECDVILENETEMTIRLTRELDQVLMNRPFYWHYMDKIGRNGEPMSLFLDTSTAKKDNKKEWIHYGSPRLQQIFHHIKQSARFTMLYEQTTGNDKTALHPWLVANIVVHYHGKQKKEAIHSIGLHLINGMMKSNMMNEIDRLPLESKMSDYSFTISPLIKPLSGFYRIFMYIEQLISSESKEWVKDAMTALNEELSLLDHFFKQQEGNQEIFAKEKEQLTERLEPRIDIEVVNAGIFYLTENFS
ncbi:YqhG family protein [Gracilibacillus sp. S3-1-1]|uniref:YqhG family protein n=1 Tax=Gracilibacillus pellucidus TaxID=3095368 RepID=A0ACC6M4X5_9BACI|nr:YqhG family protein [Gracilibacillus sp. S3-1-1]MDX8046005.1 YqhG family protein [Gracilibacillus sp. S3-1-1]